MKRMGPDGSTQITDSAGGTASVDVAAVVVTYNRSRLLLECLEALLRQSRPVKRVIVVDNASTDGTGGILEQNGFLTNPAVDYLALEKNYGNSGGLLRGLRYALNKKAGWIWVMDDDAKPDAQALQKILEHNVLPQNVYGSAAVASVEGRQKLCFPARTRKRPKNRQLEYREDLHDVEEVAWVPFLGFFIHAAMIRRIGFPDPDFFILNDDVEYSERARKHGARIYMIKGSLIDHPYQQTIPINLFGKKVYYRRMSPWKVYFDVRNKIIIAKRYYPHRLFLQTLPGILLRAFYSLLHEENRLKCFGAHVDGIISGLFGTADSRYRPPVSA